MTTYRRVFCLLISITANTYVLAAGSLPGNPAAGQEKSAACQGCHGPDGNSFSPIWPNLAGQNRAYLIKQIEDFQTGERQDPTMGAMVAGLTREDIADISAYFSNQPIKADATARSAIGKRLFEGGNHYTRTPACAGCHGPNAVGNGPGAIPLLRGQKAAYTAKSLRDFKSGTRANDRNEMMRAIADKLTEKEIDAVATFLASMNHKSDASAK